MKINVKIPKKINIGGIKTGTPPYTLPIASADVLGGIKVGENLTIDEDGTLNASDGSGSAIGEDKEMIYANLSTLYDESLTPWERKTIKLDTEISKLGENLTLTNDGRIKIGKGISKISIQCGILASALTNLGIIDFRIYVVRNGEKILINQSYAEFITLKNAITVFGFVPIYNVQENDEIELIYTSNVSGTFRVFQTGTFISVEKVNNTNVISVGSEEDTGWQDCEIGESGTWSRFKFRKIGSRVRIEGRVSNLPYNGLEYIIGKIPVEYAPPSVINTYGFTSKNIIARFNVNPSGEIKISWNLNMATGSENKGTSWYNFDFEYLLD